MQRLVASEEKGKRWPSAAAVTAFRRPGNDERLLAELFVDSILPRHIVLTVLAAEAGSVFTIRPPTYVVGVDVLQAERSQRTDAHEHRVADLEQIELEAGEYHIVVCCNVLEHLRDPLAVFPLVQAALKDDGVFVIVLPNVASLKGS